MIVLASNSPRRRELLAAVGLTFVVQPAHVDETTLPGESPQAYVLRLAERKAKAALENWRESSPEEVLFLAADTTVVVDDQILGKPDSPDEARHMLKQLSGRAHQVYTAVAVARHPDGNCLSEASVSTVIMRPYSGDEIETYIMSGDPLDKAGAYAIQHSGFHPVAVVDGCYANVVGLPVCRLGRLLEAFGLNVDNKPWQACQAATGVPCAIYLQVSTAEARL